MRAIIKAYYIPVISEASTEKALVFIAINFLTGDIAESWWLESLKRHPVLLPYFTGLKTLNTVYLDTTHANEDMAHTTFTSKVNSNIASPFAVPVHDYYI